MRSGLLIQCSLIPRGFFFSQNLEQIFLKFLWKHKRFQIAKTIFGKEEQSYRYHAPWFQTMLQSSITKTVW